MDKITAVYVTSASILGAILIGGCADKLGMHFAEKKIGLKPGTIDAVDELVDKVKDNAANRFASHKDPSHDFAYLAILRKELAEYKRSKHIKDNWYTRRWEKKIDRLIDKIDKGK